MAKNEKFVVKKTTGIGEVVGFVNVNEPLTRFDEDGTYNIDILISQEEGQSYVKEITELSQKQMEKYGKNKKLADVTACVPYVKKVKDENGKVIEEIPDSEGRYILKTKNKAYIKDGVAGLTIPVFDAKLKPINVKFGAGSKVRLGVTFEGYSTNLGNGVSIKLRMVQLLEAVNSNGFKADDFFTEAEGFEAISDNTDYESTSVEEDEEADF